MILTTTPTIEGHKIQKYLGIVTSESIIGANAFRDLGAQIRDFFGGRTRGYEKVLPCGNLRNMQNNWEPTPSLASTSTTKVSAKAIPS